MRYGATKAAAVAASLAIALSGLGSVALADEASELTTAPATEQAVTVTTAEGAATEEATSTATLAAQTTEVETVDGNGQADDTKPESSDAQSNEAAQANDATDATETPVTDDGALEAMEATVWTGMGYNNHVQIDEASVEWVPLEANIDPDVKYVDEDGYRIFLVSSQVEPTGSSKSRTVTWAKIGENGELLIPANKSESVTVNTEHYTMLNNFIFTPVLQYDDVKDELIPTSVDSEGKEWFYYPGGEFGPAGNYYYSTAQDKAAGRLILANQGGGSESGTSSASEGVVDAPHQAAAAITYTSPTLQAAETGTATIADSASATPQTGDASSLASAAMAVLGALSAFSSAKILRRE